MKCTVDLKNANWLINLQYMKLLLVIIPLFTPVLSIFSKTKFLYFGKQMQLEISMMTQTSHWSYRFPQNWNSVICWCIWIFISFHEFYEQNVKKHCFLLTMLRQTCVWRLLTNDVCDLWSVNFVFTQKCDDSKYFTCSIDTKAHWHSDFDERKAVIQ